MRSNGFVFTLLSLLLVSTGCRQLTMQGEITTSADGLNLRNSKGVEVNIQSGRAQIEVVETQLNKKGVLKLKVGEGIFEFPFLAEDISEFSRTYAQLTIPVEHSGQDARVELLFTARELSRRTRSYPRSCRRSGDQRYPTGTQWVNETIITYEENGSVDFMGNANEGHFASGPVIVSEVYAESVGPCH